MEPSIVGGHAAAGRELVLLRRLTGRPNNAATCPITAGSVMVTGTPWRSQEAVSQAVNSARS